MLPADFAHTGFTHIRPDATPITRFQVMGERSSGTNYVKRLIARNTPLRPTEDLGWKHGFPHMAAIPADLAVICVVRAAPDWARSMHAKPWHTPPHMQALEFGDFLRAPWATIVDRARYFPRSRELGQVGQPLQYDRDPASGAVYPNLPALRTAKLRGLLSYLERGCTCLFLRLEPAQDSPETTLEQISAALDLARRDGPFRPVMKRLGSKFKPAIPVRPETPKALATEDRAFLREHTDSQLETRLGYTI